MTEVKWGILFVAVFVTLVFGMEYKIQLVKGLTISKIQYNDQLDTCLTDTLWKAEIGFADGEAFFSEPDRVRKELEKQLNFVFPDWQGAALLILYEPEGFYFFTPEMAEVSEMVVYEDESSEKRLCELENFMEKQLKKRLLQAGKAGEIRFTFPREERASYGQTIQGTGILLVYEAKEAYFKGNPYERFILSGARVEDL